ncbi:hypothetical protein HYE67_006415 [Fusarium culmorum]|uniref:Uncharacterized protein n=1 Tax=Fusarium culmorum TaxID=5516 RepID=A0A7S8D8Y4_FUSCU|nr:hypothetical protein HYE67_006415 [Fusarium culmorum]
MTPRRVYSPAELEAIRSCHGDIEILRMFLSPGMAFEANISTTKDRQVQGLNKMQQDIYNAFADYGPTRGISVKPIYQPKDTLWLPEVLRTAVLSQCLLSERARSSDYQFRIVPYLSLAVFVYKCKVWFHGRFFFVVLGRDVKGPPGPLTIGLSVWNSSCFEKQQRESKVRRREKITRMAEAVEAQLPSPRVSPLLWNIFKTAFITRGKKYHSLVRDMTLEEMMAFFEGAYNS